MKYYEKKYEIDGELFVGRISDEDLDFNFYLEHQKLQQDEHRHVLSKAEAQRLVDVLVELINDEKGDSDGN